MIAVMAMASTPVGELRLAIPWAIVELEFKWYEAIIWAIIGNCIPVLVLPWVLSGLGDVLVKSPQPIRGIFLWRTKALRNGAKNWFFLYGRWALIPFVAIPFPLTGAWTACLAAWVFDVRPKESIPVIFLGLIVAAIIVTVLTEVGVSLISI